MKTFTKMLMVLSISFGLAACGPGTGRSTADDGGDGVTDAGQPTGAAQFLGTWKYTTLMGQIVCSDGEVIALDSVSGTETFTQGSVPSEVLGIDDKGCPSVCQISGNTATCQTGGAACGFTVNSDVYTYSNGTLREDMTAQVIAPNGSTCAVSGAATLVRAQ